MRARVGETTIAEADEADLVRIEGNWYFPPAAVDKALLQTSDTPYTCPWKGECQYYSVKIGNEILADRAWAYPEPYPGAIERVGRDFAGYIAFAPDVEVGD
ncbi:DUF427 domain-containing protein [Microbacterium elymi]|uniref:DUF427 domain-containing protein n=1 Tax=Microbacterium elymi TaxID=2909587 RepID=A0ABY5NMY4_9MICO|nr:MULTISPECIES: DUF427 domain-containing protein [Microbacterium]UUT36505.1 DUF427 domain-containing protein [Microbacterium elymi]